MDERPTVVVEQKAAPVQNQSGRGDTVETLRRVALAPQNRQFIHILHLTDLHFKPDTQINGLGKEAFLHTFEEGLKTPLADGHFDLVLVTGDLVDNSAIVRSDRAHRRALELARTYLEGLCRLTGTDAQEGLVVIPGNHDVRLFGLNLLWLGSTALAQFNEVFKAYRGDRYYERFPLLLACFDSNVVSRRWDLARGTVSAAEFHRVADLTSKLSNDEVAAPRIALVHHHPLPVPSAEVLSATWYERLFLGRPVGSPEDMLLRNSGVFLERMLEHGFRLVLHGHLHSRGYWRAHNTTYNGKEGWLEVISGGSLKESRRGYSFNQIKIHDDGYIESVHHGFDAAHKHDPPARVTTAPYDVVRLAPAGNAGDECQPVRCSTYLKIWEVDAAHCDLVTREMIRSLRSGSPQGCSELKLSTGSPSLTFAKVTAIRADVADEREMVVTSRPAPDAPDRVEHLLSIDPPLNAQREVTLAIQRQSDGAIYRSREDQRYMGGAESLGTDFLSIKITWPTDQLVARLRFKTDPAAVPGGASWLPRGLALEVVAADGKPRQREAESPYVMLDYPTPSRIALVGGERSAEAVLTVYRPRLGHTYKLSWPLPEQDAMPCRLQVEQLREQLLSVPATPAGRRATDEFAIAALRLFNQIRGDIPDVKDWIGKAESYLHAFNPRRGMLVCVGTSGAKQDPMAGEFRYGMDVIGTAFRRRDVWAYSRAQSDRDAGFVRFESFPSDTVQFCLGCPLNWPNRSGWPVGVLTLASGEPLTTSDPARKPQWAVDVSAAITELWMKSISAVVPDAPALPRGDSRQINVDSAGSDEIID